MATQNSAGTWVKLTPGELEARIGSALASRSIIDDAGWATAISNAFNATNASGLSATTRSLLIEFFTNFVGVGRPIP